MLTKAGDGATVMLTSGASGRINALLSLRALRSVLRLISAFFLILLLPFRGRRRCMAVAAGPESPEKGGGKEDKAAATTGKVVRVPAAMVPMKSVAAVVDKDVAARRALAIKRVVEGNERGDNEATVRDYSLFITSRGDTIFTQSWTPVKVQVRGLVVLLHGLNEHSGRYDIFAKKLNANGLKVYGMDWIGHGGSDGLHAYVHSLDDAVNDMKLFLSKVLAENPGFPCFCFGHSTGGAIILKAALDPKVRQRVAGIILTSPAIGVQPSHPIFAVLAPVFSFLFPRFQFSAANKRGIAVSRDPDALVAKYSDPLVFTGAIRVRTGYEILRITAYLQQNLSRLTVPFLVLHGTDDSVTDPEASQKLYKEASSSDKNIVLYEGLLHDLLFEPEKEEIMENIIAWLNSRLC
ncbi:alpha/beta-Hydrolases superfamily protein [Perilla frutescens var. frutescens]|nr:alpha/beta-Hydrolases superfamily protein [Perilla frutescens var. frutescens]